MLDRRAVVWSVLLSQLLTLHAFSPSAPHRRTRTQPLSVCAVKREQRGGLGGLFDEGKARIWREMQKGAMQEELDPLPSELAKRPAAVVPLVLDTVNQAIRANDLAQAKARLAERRSVG